MSSPTLGKQLPISDGLFDPLETPISAAIRLRAVLGALGVIAHRTVATLSRKGAPKVQHLT